MGGKLERFGEGKGGGKGKEAESWSVGRGGGLLEHLGGRGSWSVRGKKFVSGFFGGGLGEAESWSIWGELECWGKQEAGVFGRNAGVLSGRGVTGVFGKEGKLECWREKEYLEES